MAVRDDMASRILAGFWVGATVHTLKMLKTLMLSLILSKKILQVKYSRQQTGASGAVFTNHKRGA